MQTFFIFVKLYVRISFKLNNSSVFLDFGYSRKNFQSKWDMELSSRKVICLKCNTSGKIMKLVNDNYIQRQNSFFKNMSMSIFLRYRFVIGIIQSDRKILSYTNVILSILYSWINTIRRSTFSLKHKLTYWNI